MQSTDERGEETQRLALLAIDVLSQDGTTEPLIGFSAGMTVLVSMAHALSMPRDKLLHLVGESYDIVTEQRGEAHGVTH